MRKQNWILLAVFLFVGGIYSLSAQDLIVLRDGNMIESVVIEVSPTEIRYRRFDHLDGPVIVIPAVDVMSIRYENGRMEIITAAAQADEGPQARNRFMSVGVGYMGGVAFGFNFERKNERVSWGFDALFAAGEFMAGAASLTFRFFPAPAFFMGADIGLGFMEYLDGYWYDYEWSYGVQFAPQLGLRLGGQNSGFFTDFFIAIPIHMGSGGTFVEFRPGTRVGGSW